MLVTSRNGSTHVTLKQDSAVVTTERNKGTAIAKDANGRTFSKCAKCGEKNIVLLVRTYIVLMYYKIKYQGQQNRKNICCTPRNKMC